MTDELLRELDGWIAHSWPYLGMLAFLRRVRAAVVERDELKEQVRYLKSAFVVEKDTTEERDRYKAALERISGFSPAGAVARNVAYEALSAAAPPPPKPPCPRCGGSGRWHPAGGVETRCPECKPPCKRCGNSGREWHVNLGPTSGRWVPCPECKP